MKVLVISSNIFALPLVAYGGLEEVAFLQAVHLQKRGHQVSVVAPKGSQLPEGIELIESELRELEQNTWGRYRPRLEAGEWDVVLDSSWEKWSYMSSLSRDPQIPVIGILHSDPKIYSEPPPVRWPLFVGISESHAANIRHHLKIDCRVVLNGINLARYTIDPNVKRNGRFLFLGRYTPEKAPLSMISLARRLRLPLDCVGDTEIVGGMDYVERCRAACDGLQIRFMPGVSRDRTVELYRTHEALLNLIDWEEPYGMVVVEANACGTPVLAYNRGAMPELIQPGKNGFLFNNESEVEAFLKKPDWGSITLESCRAVAEQFSAERMCERYEQLCREVVEQGARW